MHSLRLINDLRSGWLAHIFYVKIRLGEFSIKPWIHAANSVKRYGGKIDDYIAIHDWFDSTKAAYPDTRHRAILHNSFGIYLAEQLFGHIILNSDGKTVHVRNVAEDHVIEDCGFIPTIEDWVQDIPVKDWMRGHGMKNRLDKEGLAYDIETYGE